MRQGDPTPGRLYMCTAGTPKHHSAAQEMSGAQDFQALRSSLQAEGRLYEDNTFPKDVPGAQWKRPTELFPNPKFIEGGAMTSDVCQGKLGNCWLLSAMASLTLHPKLFSRVVPEDQTFVKKEGYVGVFTFNLAEFGDYVEVVIDDLLPTKEAKLMFAQSSQKSEMWSPLLEKAYAKMSGGYSKLQGGTIPEALEDFTGGIAETVSLSKHTSEEIGERIVQSARKGFPMAAYIEAKNSSQPGEVRAEQSAEVTEDGLVLGHAYSILGAQEISGDVTLIRLRNPWGSTEYNGPWSDKSTEWCSVSQEEQRLNLEKDDGEFWMLCEDFCSFFSWMVVCHTDLEPPKYDVTHVRGRWQRGVTAGGGRRLRTFCTNPQYRFRVGGSSNKEAEPVHGKNYKVVVELMQVRRGAERLHIACHLYQVPRNLVSAPKLDRGFFAKHRPVRDTGEPQNSRGVVISAKLPAGDYVLVPSTYDANQEGDFHIRICCQRVI